MDIDIICDHLSQRIESGEIDNDGMVQIIELCGKYLNLQTIPDYAKSNNLSYNGTKKHKPIKKIFGVKFVIDNQ